VQSCMGDCELQPEWDQEFGIPGANTGIAFDWVAHDDGTGIAMYTGGTFTSIGGTAASRIAKWDGTAWSPLGSGILNNEVYAVASFGGGLYAAGYFDGAGDVPGTEKIAKWNGSAWESIDAQLALWSNQLWGLTTWDDGTGEALYIAGNYENIGGVQGASFFARYDGESFSTLGAPIGGAVPLIVYTSYAWDDGTGEAIYIGGRFLTVDGISASRIAKWDGQQWSALGSGVTGTGVSPSVNIMRAFDDGTGEQLYVAGQAFTSAGGQPANRVARWNGTEWSAVGAGFDDGIVWGLEVFDDGNGEALYAFGTFTASGGAPVNRVARWNGKTWEQVGNGANGSVYRAAVHDDGSGNAMYVGGAFTSIANVQANRIARYKAIPQGGIPGDLNDDGVVDGADLLMLLSQWGSCADCDDCVVDLNCDCVVDGSDLLILLQNWG
jgi:trimeric autotransporter adhesin